MIKKMRSVPQLDLQLRFVVYQENGCWIAHCLELDIVAEGQSARLALSDALDLCSTQIEFALAQRDLNSLFHAAPPEFWAMFSKSKPMSLKGFKLGSKLGADVQAREFEPSML